LFIIDVISSLSVFKLSCTAYKPYFTDLTDDQTDERKVIDLLGRHKYMGKNLCIYFSQKCARDHSKPISVKKSHKNKHFFQKKITSIHVLGVEEVNHHLPHP